MWYHLSTCSEREVVLGKELGKILGNFGENMFFFVKFPEVEDKGEVFFFDDDDDDYVQSNSWWWADFFFRWLDDVWNLTVNLSDDKSLCFLWFHWSLRWTWCCRRSSRNSRHPRSLCGHWIRCGCIVFKKSHHEDVQSLFFLNHGVTYYSIRFDHNKIAGKSAGVLSSPQPLLALSSSRRWTRKGFEKSPGFSPWKQPLGWDWVWWNMME